MASVNLKEDINANAVKERSLEKLVCSFEETFAKIQLLENKTPQQKFTKQNEQNSDSDGNEKRMEKPTNLSTVQIA